MKLHPSKPTRHNVRAVGKTHTTISLSAAVLAAAKDAALADDRSLSKWLERLIAQNVNAHEAANQADPHPAAGQARKPASRKPRPSTRDEGSSSFQRSA